MEQFHSKTEALKLCLSFYFKISNSQTTGFRNFPFSTHAEQGEKIPTPTPRQLLFILIYLLSRELWYSPAPECRHKCEDNGQYNNVFVI